MIDEMDNTFDVEEDGYDMGYDEGYKAGYGEAMADQVSKEKCDGYDSGHNDGRKEGYTAGRRHGEVSGQSVILDLLDDFVKTARNNGAKVV